MPELPKILLLDDEESVRCSIVWALGDFEVIPTGSVPEAKSRFSQYPNLASVISDYQMAGGDGLEFYAWIRTQSRVPFLLISGANPQLPKDDTHFSFLAKPITPERLQSELHSLIENV